MTPAGWLRNHVGDGTVTILIAGRATFVRRAELVDLVAGRLRHGATVRDVHGVYAGLMHASKDGSRYWVDLGPQWAFCWSEDLRALLAGEMVTAELQPVHGMMAEPEAVAA
jgi:hypothetical protein